MFQLVLTTFTSEQLIFMRRKEGIWQQRDRQQDEGNHREFENGYSRW